ncbi:MAG: MopE-related protein [Myxococcota bacterium]
MRGPPTLVILLLAGGCIDTQLKATSGEGAVNPDFLDFGTIAVGETATAELNVDSVGLGTLTLVSVTVEGVGGTAAFSIDGDFGGAELGKGSSLALPVLYAPTAVGWDEAEITIQTDSTVEPSAFAVPVRGRGDLPGLVVTPSSIDFGAVAPGSDPLVEVAVTCDSALAAQVVEASIGGDDSFYLDGLAVPLDVLPGYTERFSVGFGAPDTLPREAILSIVTNDPELGTVTIPIVGNQCAGEAAEDADADGVALCAGDCDDEDPDVYPGAIEVVDGVDQDCDGTEDEGTSRYDDDGDGYSEDGGDCADADATVSPSEDEDADGVDQDCDGVVDEGTDVYDDDGDGFTERGGDCDDGDADASPGSPERANATDDDCDGDVDEGTSAGDDDGDGYDEASGDCNDGDASSHPGGTETAEGTDQDCDGRVDEGTDAYDDDGDGYTEDGGDCDDASVAVGPHVLETSGDGVDNDCDGVRS